MASRYLVGRCTVWVGSLAAAVLVAEAQPASRPCTDADWEFRFGVCNEDGTRSVFAAPPQDACDPAHAESRPLPPPLEQLRCDFACPAGKYVGIATSQEGGASASCATCPAGTFSLGGGFLVSGVAGDWRHQWPVGLQTRCEYIDDAGHWNEGRETQWSCDLSVMAPEAVAGAYRVVPAHWNSHVPSAGPFVAQLQLAPGDGTACASLAPWRVAPKVAGQIAALLVAPGGCAAEVKAANAQGAGAGGVFMWDVPSPGGAIQAPVHGWQSAAPTLPLFVLTQEDGEVLSIMAKRAALLVNITSPACFSDSVFGMPAAGPTGVINTTAEDAAEPGCSPWVADRAGRFLFSGENRRHARMASSLVLSTLFVRDGYLAFRYAVDAERGYDGLVFEMDWNEVMGMVSEQLDYKDFHINVSAGAHSFKWTYAKDYGTSFGEDRAWLQLIEVAGTAHADFQCHSCHSKSTHSTAGAARCNACGAGEYLAVAESEDVARCSACPAGRWSAAGSIGEASCQERAACTEKDVELTYTQCEGNKRFPVKVWRQPAVCKTDAPGADALVGRSGDGVACEHCQPNMHRPTGGACVPVVTACAAGAHAVPELVVSSWTTWPANFTQEMWALSGQPTDHHAWHLEASGRYAFSGVTEPGSERSDGSGATAAQGGGHAHGDEEPTLGDAALQLSVVAGERAKVVFMVDVSPPEAWGVEALFYVDKVVPMGMLVERLAVQPRAGGPPKARLRGSAPLAAGPRRLTWVWQYRERLAGHGGGVELLVVNVAQAVGAGTSRCERCPDGEEVGPDGMSCMKCAPGHALRIHAVPPNASANATQKCQQCPSGYSAPRAGLGACERCPQGMLSVAGAVKCKVNDTLHAPFARGKVDLSFDLKGALAAWSAVLGEAASGGPLDVDGQPYLINLLEAIPEPGDQGEDPDFSHIWELHGTVGAEREVCAPAGTEGGKVVPDAPRQPSNLGRSLARIEPVVIPGMRGIRFRFEGSEPCPGQATRKRGAFVFFQCSPSNPGNDTVVRDERGVYHLGSLTVSSLDWSRGCADDVALQWMTASACPPCHREDYSPQPGDCGPDGTRRVAYILVEPCVGGAAAPAPIWLPCGDALVQPQVRLVLYIVIMVAMIFGCGLIAYAGYLHNKYARRHAESTT